MFKLGDYLKYDYIYRIISCTESHYGTVIFNNNLELIGYVYWLRAAAHERLTKIETDELNKLLISKI
jgi:hypothetical protein